MTAIERRFGPGGAVALALAAIYLIWGSTYLAIRFAIETLPPFTMAGVRFLVAGSILFVWARSRGAAAPRREHWRPSMVIGALLLLAGNGGVVWAESRIPSGIAALLVAIEPVWIAAFAPWVLGHRRAGPRAAVGLVAGILGVAVLVINPHGLDPSSVDAAGAAVVVFGSMAWALGSLYSIRAALPESRALASGMQMLSGGLLLVVFGGALGEWGRLGAGAPSLRSLLALAYLVVFGSIVAYSAYAFLLRAARPTLSATYAFVNPIVAVLLGWLVAKEPLNWRVGAAAVLILTGVILLILEGGRGQGSRRRSPDLAPMTTDDALVAAGEPPTACLALDAEV